MLDSRHLYFNWDRDLLLYFFARTAGPLRDDLDIVIRHVRISFDGKILERDGAPSEKQYAYRDDQQSIAQRVVNKRANHNYCSLSAFRARASLTTCWPGAIPARTSWLPPSILPALISVLRNCPLPAGTNTQSRSCRCRTALLGTEQYVLPRCPKNVAVTNIPWRIRPGLLS